METLKLGTTEPRQSIKQAEVRSLGMKDRRRATWEYFYAISLLPSAENARDEWAGLAVSATWVMVGRYKALSGLRQCTNGACVTFPPKRLPNLV